MAERVQVQGLGGAVPGISPTIQRGGQYAVQVQQAGRNKLMDLADALGQVNPLLQQYTQVADIEAEQFEEELARKSPEELAKMLKQTEGEFDKQVRKGGISWLTSPINQKRKMQAVGRAANRMFMEQLQGVNGRLLNPQEGDEELGIEGILQQEQAKFVQANPSLSSRFVGEGFQEALNAQRLGLIRQYDQQLNQKAKADFLVDNVDAAYTVALTGDFKEDFDLGQNYELINIFDSLGSFDAKKQKDFMRTLLGQVALRSEDHAFRLLDWAKRNGIKVGQAPIKDRLYDELEDLIIDNGKRARARDEDARASEIKEDTLVAVNRLEILKNGGNLEYQGETYEGVEDIDRFLNDVIEVARNDPNKSEAYVGGLIKSLEQVQTLSPDIESQLAKRLRDNSIAQRRAAEMGLMQLFKTARENEAIQTKDVATGSTLIAPEYVALEAEIRRKFFQQIDDQIINLSTSGMPLTEQSREIGQFASDLIPKLQRELNDGIAQVKDSKDKRESADQELKTLTNTVPEEAPKAPTGLSYRGDTIEEKLDKVRQAKAIIYNADQNTKQRVDSVKYLTQQGEEVFERLARDSRQGSYTTKTMPYGLAVNQRKQIVSDRFGLYGERVRVIDRFLTPEEIEDNRQNYLISAGFGTIFMEQGAIFSGLTKHGVPFDPSDLKERTKTVRMIPLEMIKELKDYSVEQVRAFEKQAKTEEDELGVEALRREERGVIGQIPDYVKRVDEAIGLNDITRLVRDQVELYRRLKFIK
jgi:hypothetical protein